MGLLHLRDLFTKRFKQKSIFFSMDTLKLLMELQKLKLKVNEKQPIIKSFTITNQICDNLYLHNILKYKYLTIKPFFKELHLH